MLLAVVALHVGVSRRNHSVWSGDMLSGAPGSVEQQGHQGLMKSVNLPATTKNKIIC